ncbi:MAG: TetR/AcrR family transcriptional regulator [Myxococcota bacterium]
MRKGAATRARLITAATQLIEQQGYAATGLKEILTLSGAPRGSLYFHFPDGKEQLAAAAVNAHANAFNAQLEAVMMNTTDTAEALIAVIDFLGARVEADACAGCPVGAVASEMAPRSERLQRATRDAFEMWVGVLASRLQADGREESDARRLARVGVGAIEGGLILCRAYNSRAPLDDLTQTLPDLLSK